MGKDSLIAVKGKDQTDQITSLEWNTRMRKYDIYYKSKKRYFYSKQSVEILRSPALIDPADVEILHKGRKLGSIASIQHFKCANSKGFLHITFFGGMERTYPVRDLELLHSCLAEKRSANVLSYLKDLSRVSELKSKDGERLLEKQYEKLTFVGEDAALALYLNPEEHQNKHFEVPRLIYPFGGNASQFLKTKAAEKYLPCLLLKKLFPQKMTCVYFS